MIKFLIIFSLLFPVVLLAQEKDNMVDDTFNSTPSLTYEKRKQRFFDFIMKNSEKNGRMIVFNQMVRISNRLPIEEQNIQQTINNIYRNRDCNDFEMNGLVRLLNMDNKKKVLSHQMRMKAEQCMIDFKYFWDDARRDTTYKCYHTENHQALYHTAELLAGQLLKDKTFKSGLTGQQHIAHAEDLLLRWLDFRFRFGFSEWLSSTYYDVEVMLLVNLFDYAENPVIRQKAGMVLDLLLFDLALNNYHGTLGSTTGRVYAPTLLKRTEGVSPVMKLCFGVGSFNTNNIMGAVSLSLSSYHCPKVIQSIAVDYTKTFRNLQQSSFNIEDAVKYGLSYENEKDVQLFWGMQEFIHPLVIGMSKQISEKNDVWPYRNYEKYIQKYENQITQYGKVITPNLDRFALSESNIETYRTPDYMLSTTNDYRPGASGYQQHIWQATLSRWATVFTNHPGSLGIGTTPNYWAGNSILPRVAQYENVMVAAYNIPENDQCGFTHAYFPRDAFDEIVEIGSWVFGSKGKGFVALYSQLKTTWKADDKGKTYDLVAKGRQNLWICEMGSLKQWGNFHNFIEAVSKSKIEIHDMKINYHSPSEGILEFGWEGAFIKDGIEINFRNEYRYNNPYCKMKFNQRFVEIKNGSDSLRLDLDNILTDKN